MFVCLVTKGSPAALGGLRFGDQILQVNGVNLAGFSSDKVCPSGGLCDVTRLHIFSGAWPDEKGGREQHNNGCQGSALWEDPHPSQGIHLHNKHGIAFSNQLLFFAQDSSGHIGFQFKDGKITSIAVDSSAARYFFLDATMFLSLLSLSKLLAVTQWATLFDFSLFRAVRCFNCSSSFLVPKRKMLSNQQQKNLTWEFPGTTSLVGCQSFSFFGTED